VFDHYVSLGNNCEVAFQMRRVLGYDRSNFFNWNITPVHSLISLLRSDFSDILEVHNLSHGSGNLFHDAAHDYYLHTEFSYPDMMADGQFESKLELLRKKSEYLIEGFRTLATRGRIAFFYKTDETDSLPHHMNIVQDLLSKYVPIDQFLLIVAQPAANLAEPRNENNIMYRPLTRLAPAWDAHDGHVSSWDRIFAEFPHKQEMRLAGY
jgi:Putative papain-like cysteine peptidase (DUF1796)